MASEFKIPKVPVLKFGWANRPRSAVFNGFAGGSSEIYSRLVALLALEDTGSDADFYRSHRRNVLSMVCGVNIHFEYPDLDLIDPPRSFQELRERLTGKWFRENFGKHAEKILEAKAETLMSLRDHVEERARPYLHILDPRGFKLGEFPVTVFSIDGTRGGQPAEYLFKFLGEAFKDAMGVDNETVWVIDEIGLFGGKVVAGFTKVGRQKGLGLVMALQSVASLGDKQYTEEILDNTNTKAIMRNDEAEELRRRAGTKKEKDLRHMEDKDGLSRGQTIGYRDIDKIPLEDVKKLPKGAGYVLIGGGIAKVRPKMIATGLFHPDMEDSTYREDRILKPPSVAVPQKEKPEDDPFKSARR